MMVNCSFFHRIMVHHHLPLLLISYLLVFQSNLDSCHALATPNNSNNPTAKTYTYFAFGSNMASSTMINLRNLSPLASSAAVLPQHELRFNIPGVPGVEPSSASVEPTASTSTSASNVVNDHENDAVHGVLYKLTEDDFATVCSTEGVPFAYSLHRCRVIPYVGDGKCAGQNALLRATVLKKGETATTAEDGRGSTSETISIQSTTTTNDSLGVAAFTLRAARQEWQKQGRDIPPSQSYLNVLLRGAKEFKLDESYVKKLENVKVGRTWIGNGLSEEMLRMAEQRNAKR